MNGFQQSAGLILVASLLSAIVGLERQWRGHPAGLRTHMLLCIGAALATLAGRYGFAGLSPGAAISPDRIAAQVVSGVGFLGAGTILKQRSGIHGLTTAASLWAVAVIGIACGAGLWAIGAFTTAVLMLTLLPVGWVEARLEPRPQALGATLRLHANALPMAAFERVAADAGLTIQGVRRSRVPGETGSHIAFELEGAPRVSLAALLEAFGAVPEVEDVAVYFGDAMPDR